MIEDLREVLGWLGLPTALLLFLIDHYQLVESSAPVVGATSILAAWLILEYAAPAARSVLRHLRTAR